MRKGEAAASSPLHLEYIALMRKLCEVYMNIL